MSDTRSTTNDLGRVITNAQARAVIYGTYIVLLTAVGAASVGFAVLGTQPQWLQVTAAVMGFLGVPVSGLSLANTTQITKDAPTTDSIESVNPENG